MCKLLFFSCVGRPPVKTAFGIPPLFSIPSTLYSYLQYQIAYILFLLVLRLLAGIEPRVQVDRASSTVNNVSELVQRLLRRKRRRTVVVGSRESPPPKSIVIVLIERLGQNKDLRGSSTIPMVIYLIQHFLKLAPLPGRLSCMAWNC